MMGCAEVRGFAFGGVRRDGEDVRCAGDGPPVVLPDPGRAVWVLGGTLMVTVNGDAARVEVSLVSGLIAGPCGHRLAPWGGGRGRGGRGEGGGRCGGRPRGGRVRVERVDPGVRAADCV